MVSATSKFYSSAATGKLPVAVPITYDDGRFGLLAGGLYFGGDSRAQKMVYSGDPTVRAAASVIACAQARNHSAVQSSSVTRA